MPDVKIGILDFQLYMLNRKFQITILNPWILNW